MVMSVVLVSVVMSVMSVVIKAAINAIKHTK